ncbi:hypothetical protein QYE76_070976 [Lolium multiflorum]|uniref:Cytochrome P450 n=1 Tax=Lolium multiflorum TaxID=4521 RepID=A0AAD8SKN7_LOLMU|nr:hypothetical protein QYE76_070976 [Lolium multiflorum]
MQLVSVRVATMALSFLQELFLASSLLFLFIPLYRQFKFRSSKTNPALPTDWPVVGMLPSLIANIHDFHGYATALFAASGPGHSYEGHEFASFFDTMGGSFFNADGESWRRQRARVQHLMASPRLLAFMAGSCRDKVENGLMPALARAATARAPFDMQELLTRFAFDMTAMPVFGVDPGLLSVHMPPMDVPNAMDAVMEVGFFRHTVPISCWKLMRSLRIGPERKLAVAQPVLRRFVAEMLQKRAHENDGAHQLDIVSSYIDDPEYVGEDGEPKDFLYATIINYMFAGRDTVGTTLAWLLYNLTKHPHVVSNIRRELAPIVASRNSKSGMAVFDPDETKPLVYLSAALFESMRLHPPGPIERKAVLADDVLPSGHEVRAGDTVLISVYSMGRMERVWGEDCAEYRPERWVTEDGGTAALRHVPAHRFMPFNAGPRSCLGKDVSVAQMKSVVAAVVWNFDLEVVPGHVVEPKLSVVLQMKNGLVVTAARRGSDVADETAELCRGQQ